MPHIRELEEAADYVTPVGYDEPDEVTAWNISSRGDTGSLEIIEQHYGSERVLYAESDMLEGLLGYEADELADELDRNYDLRLSDSEFGSYEYGNGWALLHLED